MTSARDTLNRATTEAAFQGFVVTVAERFGWLVWHDNDSRKNRPGLPDLLLVHPAAGDLLVVELKSEGGTVTKAQQAWLSAFAAAGVETHVWKPSQTDEVLERLRTPRSTQRSATHIIAPVNRTGEATQAAR